MRAAAIFVPLSLFIATPVLAVELEAGLLCAVRERIALMAKAGDRSALLHSKLGESVEIIEPGLVWTRVKARNTPGFMKTVFLAQICEVLSHSSAPPGSHVEPARPSRDEPVVVVSPGESASAAVPETVVVNTGEPSVATPAESSDGHGDAAFGQTYKIKMAVMSLTGSKNVDPELLVSLTYVVSETLEALGPFKAISSEEIKQMLAFESQQQMMGCDDVSCLAEIGGALGADFLVTGGITKFGTKSIIQLQLASIREARVENRVSRDESGEPDELFDAMRSATKQLVREILGQHAGRLRIAVSEEGATISIDGSIIGVSPLPEPLTIAGGSHNIAIEKRGFILYRRDFGVQEDRETVADVVLLPSAEFIRDYKEGASFVRTLAWIGLGLGGASLVASAALFAGSAGQASQLDADVRSYNNLALRTTEASERLAADQRAMATFDVATTITFGIGIAAAATGAVLYLIGDNPGRYDAMQTRTEGPAVSVRLGPTGLLLRGQF